MLKTWPAASLQCFSLVWQALVTTKSTVNMQFRSCQAFCVNLLSCWGLSQPACTIVPLQKVCKCCRAVAGCMCQPGMAHGQVVWTEWWVTAEQWFQKLLLVASLLSLAMTGECCSAWSGGPALPSSGPRWVGLMVWEHFYFGLPRPAVSQLFLNGVKGNSMIFVISYLRRGRMWTQPCHKLTDEHAKPDFSVSHGITQ